MVRRAAFEKRSSYAIQNGRERVHKLQRWAMIYLVALFTLCGAQQSTALDASQLAIIYNERDEDSARLARFYAKRRGVPTEQVVGVDAGPPVASLSASLFTTLHHELKTRLPSSVQAYALMWTFPYRVECMSITSAFAFGFDPRYCATGCAPTAASDYFGSSSTQPFLDYGMRPAMLVSAGSFAASASLIERGVRADGSHPEGAAYLVTTADKHRNTRSPRYALIADIFYRRLPVHLLSAEGVAGVNDVLFYFTGTKRVPFLNDIGFVDGAMADHLTSSGGKLDGTAQMTALEWIRAGATGSYGTVVEPCNFPQKFPDPAIAMAHYLNGDSLLEAYWKSVMWPGQGLFIGEPLARPFARRRPATAKPE